MNDSKLVLKISDFVSASFIQDSDITPYRIFATELEDQRPKTVPYLEEVVE